MVFSDRVGEATMGSVGDNITSRHRPVGNIAWQSKGPTRGITPGGLRVERIDDLFCSFGVPAIHQYVVPMSKVVGSLGQGQRHFEFCRAEKTDIISPSVSPWEACNTESPPAVRQRKFA